MMYSKQRMCSAILLEALTRADRVPRRAWEKMSTKASDG